MLYYANELSVTRVELQFKHDMNGVKIFRNSVLCGDEVAVVNDMWPAEFWLGQTLFGYRVPGYELFILEGNNYHIMEMAHGHYQDDFVDQLREWHFKVGTVLTKSTVKTEGHCYYQDDVLVGWVNGPWLVKRGNRL